MIIIDGYALIGAQVTYMASCDGTAIKESFKGFSMNIRQVEIIKRMHFQIDEAIK